MSDEYANAMSMRDKIIRKAENALEPLDREMKIMKWKPEYQAIMWEAVMLEATKRMREVRGS